MRIYGKRITIPRFSETGTWTLYGMGTRDELGNYSYIYGSELEKLGFTSEFEVLNSETLNHLLDPLPNPIANGPPLLTGEKFIFPAMEMDSNGNIIIRESDLLQGFTDPDGEDLFITDLTVTPSIDKPIVVTANNGKYYFNGEQAPVSEFKATAQYTFDLSDQSLKNHPFKFKLDGNEYTNNVEINGTQGSDGANIKVIIPEIFTGNFEYYCENHHGMGNSIDIVGASVGWISSNNDGTFTFMPHPTTQDEASIIIDYKINDASGEYVEVTNQFALNPASVPIQSFLIHLLTLDPQ